MSRVKAACSLCGSYFDMDCLTSIATHQAIYRLREKWAASREPSFVSPPPTLPSHAMSTLNDNNRRRQVMATMYSAARTCPMCSDILEDFINKPIPVAETLKSPPSTLNRRPRHLSTRGPPFRNKTKYQRVSPASSAVIVEIMASKAKGGSFPHVPVIKQENENATRSLQYPILPSVEVSPKRIPATYRRVVHRPLIHNVETSLQEFLKKRIEIDSTGI